MDGIPDAVTLPAGEPSVVVIDYDADDADGELDVLLANLSGAPLAEGGNPGNRADGRSNRHSRVLDRLLPEPTPILRQRPGPRRRGHRPRAWW